MAGWTKLHSRIVKSSIWSAPDHVRILWITMLAEADADGFVDSSVPGLKQTANLTLEQTEEALEVLEGPDPYSSDGTTGERVMRVPGGWWIKNHNHYRDVRTKKQQETARRVRKCRERKRQEEEVAEGVTCNDVTQGNAPQQKVTSGSVPASSSSSSSSSSDSAEQEKTSRRPKPATRPDDIGEELWQDWCDHRRRKRASMSQTVVDSLRRKAESADLTLAQALEIQLTNGWQGFEAHWLPGRRQGGNIPKTTPPQTYDGPTIDEL
jgi:hypothetical protein